MKRSYLEKACFKKKTPHSSTKFKKQKNYRSRLYKKKRKKYFESLNPRRISDSKCFSNNAQPFLSEKRKISNKVTLVDNTENTIFDDHLVSEELKDTYGEKKYRQIKFQHLEKVWIWVFGLLVH